MRLPGRSRVRLQQKTVKLRVDPAAGTAHGYTSRPMQLLASLVFTLFLFAWTFLYSVVFVCMAVCVSFPRRAGLARVWAVVLLKALKWTCRLDYTVEDGSTFRRQPHRAVETRLPPGKPWRLASSFPARSGSSSANCCGLPFVGWSIRLLHAIAIDRGAGRAAVNQVVEQGRQRLQEGDWIVMFPEGTRMPAGQTRRYGVSGAVLASQTGRLIIPVAHNAGYFWPAVAG